MSILFDWKVQNAEFQHYKTNVKGQTTLRCHHIYPKRIPDKPCQCSFRATEGSKYCKTHIKCHDSVERLRSLIQKRDKLTKQLEELQKQIDNIKF